MSEVAGVIRNIGFYDYEITNPSPNKLGFKAVNNVGTFILLECKKSDDAISILYSESSRRLSEGALQHLQLLETQLRKRFGETSIHVSEPR